MYKTRTPRVGMDSLIATIETTLDTKRSGAKLVTRDTHTVVLFHNEFVSQHVLELIREQFPMTEVSVQTSQSSRSGYVVEFTMLERRNFWLSSDFMFMCLSVLLVLCVGTVALEDCVYAHA